MKLIGLIIQKYFFGCQVGCGICMAAAAFLSLYYQHDYLVIGLCVGLAICATLGHIISLVLVFLGARLTLKSAGVFDTRDDYESEWEFPDRDTNNYLLFKRWDLKNRVDFYINPLDV